MSSTKVRLHRGVLPIHIEGERNVVDVIQVYVEKNRILSATACNSNTCLAELSNVVNQKNVAAN